MPWKPLWRIYVSGYGQGEDCTHWLMGEKVKLACLPKNGIRNLWQFLWGFVLTTDLNSLSLLKRKLSAQYEPKLRDGYMLRVSLHIIPLLQVDLLWPKWPWIKVEWPEMGCYFHRQANRITEPYRKCLSCSSWAQQAELIPVPARS